MGETLWPLDRYGIVHRATALAAGISERRLAAAVHSGELIVVARGMAIPAHLLVGRIDAGRIIYRYRCIAAAIGAGRPVLSHESAAVVHGMQLLYPEQRYVHVTNGRDGGGSTRSQRIIHSGLLDDDDVVEVGGLLVTSLERTALDLALKTQNLPQALAAFDTALRNGGDAEDFERRLRASRHGIALARHAFAFADGDSESPGESWSRAQMIEADHPLPELQVEYTLESGRTARCDFGRDGLFVGEFDGMIKYQREMRDGEDVEDVVIREKLREDQLRDLGLDVGRWIWDDLRAKTMIPKLEKRYDRLGIRY
ncbi:type IV toxin-antitoxin system AbiEi family antitoxin domain-containing protein [Gordonia phthalatica]|uniref:AbiEi antitoxin C-terminal domain-containing protein n=1 Tax=Gordonia phthalatica TaxID=1136941 RepID=A0A0N9N343_9ACTN|nr:type IV toxin-antitoxin system AbiEi family antitoxin domain-containing protein [Gordonia phthalatica]ALG84725.1 hypothetical protein ACH46_09740 [Gordonia phthalatica]